MVLGICFVLFLIPKTRWGYGVPTTIAVGISGVLNQAMKFVIQRPRPDDVLQLVETSGYSFPSGHTMIAATLYFMLILIIWWRWKNEGWKRTTAVLGLVLLILVVGISRVYLGAHFMTDIIVGWALGMAIAYAVYRALVYLASKDGLDEDWKITDKLNPFRKGKGLS
jgi:undecaprenyl-diphosphatase